VRSTGTAADAPNESPPPSNELSVGYQIFILVLSICAIALAAAMVFVDLDESSLTLIEYADWAVCGVFLVDFAVTFAQSPNKLRYLATWGWLDLLSSLPAIDIARWGRAARVFRIVRVLRAMRATRIVASLTMRYRARNAVLASAILLLLVVFSCSVAILHFEDVEEGNIRSPSDALWWAMTTVTTVGYGDFYPITWEGRILAVILMLTGVGVFSTLAGAMSTVFLTPAVDEEESAIRAMRSEILALRQIIEERIPPQP
jgi:voltage-gated potassium channel